jgi:hypothetical protein
MGDSGELFNYRVNKPNCSQEQWLDGIRDGGGGGRDGKAEVIKMRRISSRSRRKS